jgi:hypothetical protein
VAAAAAAICVNFYACTLAVPVGGEGGLGVAATVAESDIRDFLLMRHNISAVRTSDSSSRQWEGAVFCVTELSLTTSSESPGVFAVK